MSEFVIPNSILAEFGQPEFWAVTLVDTTVDEVEHWRTLGYTGALRHLENVIKGAGKDIHSGEWRIYEVDPADVPSAFPGEAEGDLAGIKVVLAVARGVS
jgi:hypothetical protein